MMQNRQWYALQHSGRIAGTSRWVYTETTLDERRPMHASTEFAIHIDTY